MADLFINDTSVLRPDGSVAPHQDVCVEEGRFQSIRPHGAAENVTVQAGDNSDAAARQTASSPHGCVIDGRGKLVMPPLADCHMHTGQQLLKGQILDELPMIWTRIMLPFESTLTPERMRLSAGLAALE